MYIYYPSQGMFLQVVPNGFLHVVPMPLLLVENNIIGVELGEFLLL